MAKKKEYPHLPDDRLPGPQSKRAHGVLRSAWPLKITGLLCIAGAVVLYVLGMSCSAGDTSCQPVLFLWFSCGVLLFGLLMYWIGRFIDKRKRRRNAPHLQLSLPRGQFHLGETIEPQLRITSMSRLEGDLEVGLVCTCFFDYEYEVHTQHGTSTSRQTRSAPAFEEWKPADKTPEQTLSFEIPADGPYSHEGSAVSFAWKVTARERRRGIDRFTDLPFWVELWA